MEWLLCLTSTKRWPDVHTKLTRQTQPATLGTDIREAYITDIPVYFDACQNPWKSTSLIAWLISNNSFTNSDTLHIEDSLRKFWHLTLAYFFHPDWFHQPRMKIWSRRCTHNVKFQRRICPSRWSSCPPRHEVHSTHSCGLHLFIQKLL